VEIDDKHIEEIKRLCEEHRVKHLSAFGSVTTGFLRDDSDIDFVVDFEENDPFRYADLYFQLKEKLEELLNRQVDLIEERAIRNRFFKKELEETKIPIYG
jgi:predicted nucleotidyltransferase